MSNICFKYKDQEKPEYYYYIPEDAFVVSDRFLICNYCEEYEIIQKIQKNKEGFFDFSKNIIDIGADDGNYAMLLNFKYNYCFEPNKRSSCILYANMYLKDKVYNTEVYNIPLSNVEEDIQFDGFACNLTDNDDLVKIYKNTSTYEQSHTVKTKTLDSFNIQNVGLVKIDVEGFEEKVIRGSLMTIISNNYPPILFECWDVGVFGMTQEKRDSLFNLLKTLGYKIFEYWGDNETHLAVHKTQLENN